MIRPLSWNGLLILCIFNNLLLIFAIFVLKLESALLWFAFGFDIAQTLNFILCKKSQTLYIKHIHESNSS